MKSLKEIDRFINNSWKNTIRSCGEPDEYRNSDNDGTLIPLPNPYTAPSPANGFQNMFYWDTWFTNAGLLRHGCIAEARANAGNLLYLLDRYGFVPNGNRTFFLNRSQPPLLALIVKDIHDCQPDSEWLRHAYGLLSREYDFWMQKRNTPTGLNRYGHHASKQEMQAFFADIAERIPFTELEKADPAKTAAHYLAEAESGWDFTPRFMHKCADFIPVDLNSYLFMVEKTMAEFSSLLKIGDASLWIDWAEKRKELVNTLLWNAERGLYCDYNFIEQTISSVASAAAFSPLWAGLAENEQAADLQRNLFLFECEGGLAACENSRQKTVYQWDYPNGWPPLHLIAVVGLLNYNYQKDARRIARKFLLLMQEIFDRTGQLWEKYNVANCSIAVNDEYEMPPMMGWTAGVFTRLFRIIENDVKT